MNYVVPLLLTKWKSLWSWSSFREGNDTIQLFPKVALYKKGSFDTCRTPVVPDRRGFLFIFNHPLATLPVVPLYKSPTLFLIKGNSEWELEPNKFVSWLSLALQLIPELTIKLLCKSFYVTLRPQIQPDGVYVSVTFWVFMPPNMSTIHIMHQPPFFAHRCTFLLAYRICSDITSVSGAFFRQNSTWQMSEFCLTNVRDAFAWF